MPVEVLTSKSFTPSSSSVGTLGSCGERRLYRARGDVDVATGRPGNDDAQGLCGKFLREGVSGKDAEESKSKNSPHVPPP
jgi:hypothetical protein